MWYIYHLLFLFQILSREYKKMLYFWEILFSISPAFNHSFIQSLVVWVIIMIQESIQVSNFVVANGKLIENVHSEKKKKLEPNATLWLKLSNVLISCFSSLVNSERLWQLKICAFTYIMLLFCLWFVFSSYFQIKGNVSHYLANNLSWANVMYRCRWHLKIAFTHYFSIVFICVWYVSTAIAIIYTYVVRQKWLETL